MQAARIGAPLRHELRPGEFFGFGRAGGFLRGRQLRRGQRLVDDVQVVGGPFAQLSGAPRPGGDGVAVDAGQLGHPGRRVDGRPFQAQGVVEFAAQGGLIDHPGRAGFVIQRRPVDGHHDAVGAGLPVGDDDVGVQVRVPAPRGLVLIGDRRQTGQAHEVFLAGVRVVDPGVAGMGGQVFHRLGDRGGVGVGDRLGQHIVIAAQGPHERDALGCAERQIEAVHTALPERAPPRAVGRDAVVEPAGHQLGVGLTARRAEHRSGPPTWRRCGCRRPAAMSGCGFRARSSTPPTRRPRVPITAGGLGGSGGVDVVVDRPPLELGDRQHLIHPPTVTAAHRIQRPRLWHMLCHNHSRTLVQMCHAESWVGGRSGTQ